MIVDGMSCNRWQMSSPTPVCDHSVFEAFSRVVHRLIPELPTLEYLLNILVGTYSMEKAYLFNVASKLYISTDLSPVDMQSVELCSDMIDVVLDVSGIYGAWGAAQRAAHHPRHTLGNSFPVNCSLLKNIDDEDDTAGGDEVPPLGGGDGSNGLAEEEEEDGAHLHAKDMIEERHQMRLGEVEDELSRLRRNYESSDPSTGKTTLVAASSSGQNSNEKW